MALSNTELWMLIGKANAVFAKAEKAKFPPDMLLPEVSETVLSGMTKRSFADLSIVPQKSKYGEYAKKHGHPLIAMPPGKVEADPVVPPKRKFWKPSI